MSSLSSSTRRWARLLPALGVFAAGVLLAEVNLWGSRHFTRWDLSQDRNSSLSEPTLALLRSLREPVEIISLLSARDPLALDARHLLTSYQAASPWIRVKFIDPDRDTLEFLALDKQHDVLSETSEEGSSFAETSFLIRKGARSWYIRSQQLLTYDEEGYAVLRLEALLTEGIARVEQQEKLTLCFTTGHGERSLDDLGPEGLSELRRRLEKSNFEVLSVPLDTPHPEEKLQGCSGLVVPGAERPWSSRQEQAVQQAGERGASLFLLLDPIVQNSGRIEPPGFQDLFQEWGVSVEPGFVLERDPARKLPRGLGEAFFAGVATHPITRGLATDEMRSGARPILVGSQALQLTPASSAQALLLTSPRAQLLRENIATGPLPRESQQRLVLAAALELPAPAPGARPRRAVLLGTSSLASNDSYRNPELYGNRLFLENAIAWLTDRPALVSVPERRARPVGLSLSEESLQELFRYVVFYMPATAFFTGLFLLMRRRSQARSHSTEESAE